MMIHRNRISLSTLVLGSLLSMLTAFSQGTLRIMPLGNSISYGNMCLNGTIDGCVPISGTEAISYRYRLLNLMNNAGYSVDFIGSQKSGSKYLTDTDNSGFGGISDDRLADIMEKGYSDYYNDGKKYSSGPYLESYPADIILLHIGTNDVLGEDTSNVKGVERILNAIDAYEAKSGSSIMVFLARIISYRDHPCNTQPRVIAYNKRIDQLVANRIVGGDNLILVDMECGATINYSTDMADEVHPNQVGYNKMGDLWFVVLDSYLRSVYVKHTITAMASANGSIYPSGQVVVDDGKDQRFTITPASGYEIDNVTVDGISKNAITNYTFARVTMDHSISASFKSLSFKIDASAGLNGSIDPEGSVFVDPGSSQSFTITPDEGYEIDDILVDGTSAGAITDYTFSSVSGNHSIVASFKIRTYEIITLISGNGRVNPEGPVIVDHGSGQTFNILPGTDYKIVDVLVNGKSVGPVSEYEFLNVSSDQNLQVTFGRITHTVTATSLGNGNISPAGAVVVNQGSDYSLTIKPDVGYGIDKVLVDDVSVGAKDSYTFRNVRADHTITVSFKILSYKITSGIIGNGNINPKGSVSAEYGSDQTFIIIPDEGHQVISLLIDASPYAPVSFYTFSNVTEDHSIIAVFEIVAGIGNNGISPGEKAISSIYPNPSNGDFSIYFNKNYFSLATSASIRIIDPEGRTIYQEELPTIEVFHLGMKQVNLDNSKIENGVYFVELNVAGDKEVWKVVIGK